MKPQNTVWEGRSFSLDEEGKSPWLVCITSSLEGIFLAREVLNSKPTASGLWKIFIQAIEHSESIQAFPPDTLKVEPNQGWEPLKRRLNEMGIMLVRTRDLDYPDGFPEWINSVQ